MLERFLEGLPPDGRYAYGVRNRELMHPDLYEILAAYGVTAVLAHHPACRTARAARPSEGPLVVRWMLRRGLRYDAAKARYAPFRERRDPDDATRDAIADEVIEAALAARPTYVIVNNKAEGSSPLSVRSLAEEVARRWPQEGASEPSEPRDA